MPVLVWVQLCDWYSTQANSLIVTVAVRSFTIGGQKKLTLSYPIVKLSQRSATLVHLACLFVMDCF